MTPEARQRIASRRPTGSSFSNGVYDSYESLSLYDRCITRGYPSSMLPAIYGDSYQIVQGQGFVAIRIEMIHETRIIPLGNQPHASKGIELDMGDPRGHWEGNTLVVETTNFRDRTHLSQRQPGDVQARRALHADVEDVARVDGDGGRSRDVDEAVDASRCR